jgi:hypothetical protein
MRGRYWGMGGGYWGIGGGNKWLITKLPVWGLLLGSSESVVRNPFPEAIPTQEGWPASPAKKWHPAHYNRHCLFKELVLVTFPSIPPIPPLKGRWPVGTCTTSPPQHLWDVLGVGFLDSQEMTISEIFDMHFVKLMVVGQYLVSAPLPQRKVTSTDLSERRYHIWLKLYSCGNGE